MATIIKPEQVSSWSGRFIDVRDPDEFLSERLPRAECIPLTALAQAAGGWDRSQRVLLVCRSGMRAAQAAGQLDTLGFSNVSVLEGGLQACRSAGLEVITGRRVIPLFRQVMIGAGLILLATLIVARFYPLVTAATWFVAAMLVFAGTTGVCPMQSLLARMPWNTPGDATNGQSCGCKTT